MRQEGLVVDILKSDNLLHKMGFVKTQLMRTVHDIFLSKNVP